MFSHGQFYVAFSRVSAKAIQCSPHNSNSHNTNFRLFRSNRHFPTIVQNIISFRVKNAFFEAFVYRDIRKYSERVTRGAECAVLLRRERVQLVART